MTVDGITTIGLIGAGSIGSQLARLGVRHGYRVLLSNSRGPETLADTVADIGAGASAGTTQQAAEHGDVVVVTIPLKNIAAVPAEPLAGKIVIDTNNYYPSRDGRIAELDDRSTTTAELLQRHLPQSKVVKAFNHIYAGQLTEHAVASGTAGRRALAINGDAAAARATGRAMSDEFGFDVVDGGPLADSWRIENGTPGYGAVDTSDELREHLAAATR